MGLTQSNAQNLLYRRLLRVCITKVERDRSRDSEIASTVFPSVDIYEYVIAFDFDFVAVDGFDRRHTKGFAGNHAESRAVPRALNLFAVQFPLGEGTAIVGADVLNGVEFSVHIEERDRYKIHFDQLLFAGRYFANFGDFENSAMLMPPRRPLRRANP